MNTSLSTSPAKQVESIDPAAILRWMGEVRSMLMASPTGELLDFDGIDAFDVLLSPIYLHALNALRQGPAQPPLKTRKTLEGARSLGYHLKMRLLERIAAWRSAAPKRADVVLWTRDITHTVTLHPVSRALEAEGMSWCMLACQPRIFKELRRMQSPAVYALGAWPRIVLAARREGAWRAKELTANSGCKLPDIPGYGSAGLESTVRETLVHFLPAVSEAIAIARAVLDQTEARVLVVGNDVTLEGRAGCRVAQGRGIPTAVFMHGSVSGSALQSQHCADRLLVFGKIQRMELMHQGIADERIVVCGAPSLDDRKRQSGRTHPRLQSRLGLRDGEPWILVATSGPGHSTSLAHHRRIIDELVGLSKALPSVPIVIKLHRKDRLEYYRERITDHPAARLHVVAQDAYGFPRDIFDWLQGCSMLLTGASTVAMEAMLSDVPVITMDYCNEIPDIDFIKAGATVHVTRPGGLEDAVRKILATSGAPRDVLAHMQDYLEGSFFAMDGRSAQRGAESLRELSQHPASD
jgi:hypothetical protein